MNDILLEFDCIKRGRKGWLITEHGKKLGATQGEGSRSSDPYVKWPESFLISKH